MTWRYKLTGIPHSIGDLALRLQKDGANVAEIFVSTGLIPVDNYGQMQKVIRAFAPYKGGDYVIAQAPYEDIVVGSEERRLELEAIRNGMLIKAVEAAAELDASGFRTTIDGKPSWVTRHELGIEVGLSSRERR